MTFVGVDRSNDNGNEIVTMIMTDTDDNNVMMAMKIMIGLIGVYPYIHLFIIKIIFLPVEKNKITLLKKSVLYILFQYIVFYSKMHFKPFLRFWLTICIFFKCFSARKLLWPKFIHSFKIWVLKLKFKLMVGWCICIYMELCNFSGLICRSKYQVRVQVQHQALCTHCSDTYTCAQDQVLSWSHTAQWQTCSVSDKYKLNLCFIFTDCDLLQSTWIIAIFQVIDFNFVKMLTKHHFGKKLLSKFVMAICLLMLMLRGCDGLTEVLERCTDTHVASAVEHIQLCEPRPVILKLPRPNNTNVHQVMIKHQTLFVLWLCIGNILQLT